MPRRKKEFPPIGSISSGTLRPEDLLAAFSDYCRDYGGKDGRKLYREYDALPAWDDMTEEQQETAEHILEEMTECLQNAAPDFVNFGTSEGDGAEFGFWPDIESLEESARGTNPEVLKVNGLENVPRGYVGHVMEVNDHGNVTLYWKSARKLTELWSCV